MVETGEPKRIGWKRNDCCRSSAAKDMVRKVFVWTHKLDVGISVATFIVIGSLVLLFLLARGDSAMP